MSKPGSTSGPQVPLPRSRRGFRSYWTELGRELKKVTWPPHKETTRLTGVVIAISSLMVLMLTVFALVSAEVIRVITRGF
ncbi:MAG: preprotein translocase subunit SecE [Armatimonadetes bacterium]|nr:MAG: preprotein translocase subunit SecE [Armatimonadota bacterium]MCC6351843.1 preprotein translocase subunit SecE [Fimbriimonadaceae bacterium]MBL1152832.1 preprotein translocase subunit SecE [Armatimonadota bacterium]MCK6633077.1 preprotein translocase subunit SecE [Fimbriimonadaceae bacterium]MCZ7581533.1 preprotein translocase subunit SecE [Fimbriimonadaceae bacterium]